MNKINNYQDLLAERKRLEGDLLVQKTYINDHLHAIRKKFEPIERLVAFVEGFKSKTKNNSLLKLGSTVGIDLLIGQKLKKVGWLTRMLVPLAMKLTARKTIDKVQNSLGK